MQDLRSQAFSYIADVTYALSLSTGDSLEDAARIAVKADPVNCAGENSEGREIRFDWSFGYEDIPEIARRAQTLAAEVTRLLGSRG